MSQFCEEKQSSALPYLQLSEEKQEHSRLYIQYLKLFHSNRKAKENSKIASTVCLVLTLIVFITLASYFFAANWNSGLDIKDRLRKIEEKITGHCDGSVSDKNGKLEILSARAEAFYERGDYVMAYVHYNNLHNATSKQLGPNHKETLKAQSQAGYMLVRQWQFERAEEVLTEVVTKQRKCPGPDHAETLRTEYYMAYNYYLQGDYVAAKGLAKGVQARQEVVMGAEAAEVIETRTLNGQVLIAQERYAEAHVVLQEVVNSKPSHNSARGNQNKIVANCMCAKALANSGKVAEAQESIMRTRTVAEVWYGKTHPVYVETQTVEAEIMVKQGNYTVAEAIYEQTVETQKWRYKGNHPILVTTITSYARVLREDNRTEQACEMLGKYQDVGEQVGPKKWKYVVDYNKEWVRCSKPTAIKSV